MLAHPSAGGELYEACQQASAGNGHLGQKTVTGIKAMVHVLHAHGNSHGQGYHPQVEGCIGYAGQHPCKDWCKPAHQYSAYKGQEQKGENLQHYLGECCPEGNVAILVNQRYHGGDEQRCHQVGQDDVHGQRTLVATQFARDYRRRRGRGAYHAQEEPFHAQAPCVGHGYACQCQCSQHPETSLQGQSSHLPAAQMQVGRLHFQEGEQKHEEEQGGLCHLHHIVCQWPCPLQCVDAG